MKNIIIVLTLFLIGPAARAGVGEDRPNALAFELLGRGILYGITYDRSLNDQWALGAGFSAWKVDNEYKTTSVSVVVIPIYTNYYFSPERNRGFLTAGLDLVAASVSDKVDNSTLSGSGGLLVLGGGYEYRGDSGFLFRLAPYLLAGSGGARFWFGISFGYAF